MSDRGTDIVQYGDKAMFKAQPIQREAGARVTPRVSLLSATADPLGSLAAGFLMYGGQHVYDLQEITDEQRRWAWEESLKTHLKAPWEFIDLQFMIEGVSRGFTHQIVRQRTAAFAQESLRFAVKENLASECMLPPGVVDFASYAGEELNPTHEKQLAIYTVWDNALKNIGEAYDKLIAAGVPAEDARGLLPHCVTTRLIYKTNFRGLIEHAGNRLCTQAQFEWRKVFMGFMAALRDKEGYMYRKPASFGEGSYSVGKSDWQFRLLAQPVAQTFTPVCYKAGKCTFMGTLDRACTIRERVQAFSEAGVPSEKWSIEGINWAKPMAAIRAEEWMLNPDAGITHDDRDRPKQ